jgi:hypothetical protein
MPFFHQQPTGSDILKRRKKQGLDIFWGWWDIFSYHVVYHATKRNLYFWILSNDKNPTSSF